MVGQSPVERNEDSDNKDKKKKRRSRRSKQSPSSISVSSSVNETRVELPECSEGASKSNSLVSNGIRQFRVSSPVAFHSLPTMHVTDQAMSAQSGDVQNQQLFSSDFNARMCLRSCQEPIASGESLITNANKDFPQSNQSDSCGRRKYFAPYWSTDDVNHALERGDAFKALFRVNGYNRLEAYCKIDGVQTDVLVSGLATQNRAVEEDIVAIKVDPPSLWPRIKGSIGPTNGAALIDDTDLNSESNEFVRDSCKAKNKIVVERDLVNYSDCLHPSEGLQCENGIETVDHCVDGICSSVSGIALTGCAVEYNEGLNSVEKLSSMLRLFPSKRPTGKVVAILERSSRRNTIVGFLNVKQWVSCKEAFKNDLKKNRHSLFFSSQEYILFAPMDPKFPKMMVSVGSLPDNTRKRLANGDATVDMELFAARIVNWDEESNVPEAHVMYNFGRGGEVKPRIAAILFENEISSSEFTPEALSCLPNVPWQVPQEELQSRRDFRHLCIFTIDPATATDLDDALSVESLSNGIFRVGVHIADASYFVLPDTALDIEAQIRSTSVYLLQSKLPMLPPLFSENLGSLNPGVDRLSFSIFWDINPDGEVLGRWIGRTIIRSCCKLSYEHAQYIIDGLSVNFLNTAESSLPELHGCFELSDVIASVNNLHEIAKLLRRKRFNNGALALESPKMSFLFDEDGIPYDSMLCRQKDSNVLVEEFMLLANRTAAEVISRAYPSFALLRRHPEPNLRKLSEFEAFCRKHGIKLDASSSGKLHHSLESIRHELKNDSVLIDILMSYASKPMQLAVYFCSGEDTETDWSHYALATPLYTHFTSPLRRYPDIIVHRILAATLEAEEMHFKHERTSKKLNGDEASERCFTGVFFYKDTAESSERQTALSDAASKHRIPCTEILRDVAIYCNERTLASRHVKDSIEKLYMWVLLKKKKLLFTEARVLALGPRFMSIYIHKLAIERRIYYDEVEGLTAEWLDTTSALVLNLCANKRFHRRGSPSKWRALEEVALLSYPYDLKSDSEYSKDDCNKDRVSQVVGDKSKSGILDMLNFEPSFFPLTVRLLSTIPVALHAIGGDDGPIDIGVRLYISSYFR